MPEGSRLGAQKAASAFTPLHAVNPQGGLVPMTVVTIQRVMQPVLRAASAADEAAPGPRGESVEALRVSALLSLSPVSHTQKRGEKAGLALFSSVTGTTGKLF